MSNHLNNSGGGFHDCLHRALGWAVVYRAFQRLFGADRARRTLVTADIRSAAGHFVVDLGCGPVNILDYLPEVRYIGLDVNPDPVFHPEQGFARRSLVACDRR